MKFRIKTYLVGEPRKDNISIILEYIFNLMYRSIIPILLFYMIREWEKPIIADIGLTLLLAFFVLYQFTWSVKR